MPSLSKLLGPLGRPRAEAPDAAPTQSPAAALQAKAWDQARELARGQDPDFSQYLLCAMRLTPEAETLGVRWTKDEIADFSGQTLKNVVFRDHLNGEMRDLLRGELETLEERRLAQSPNGVRTLTDSYDLDGDHKISSEEVDDFYKEMTKSVKLYGSICEGIHFQPATTLVDVMGKAEGASFRNVTLDGLEAGQALPIHGSEASYQRGKPDTFTNVTLRNCHGDVDIQHATLNNLRIEGSDCSVNIALSGQINKLVVDNSIVNLDVKETGRITRISLNGTTLHPDSKLNGIQLQGGSLNDITLSGVQLTNGQLSDINIHNPTLDGASFAGTELKHVQFSGIAAKDFPALKATLDGAAFEPNQVHINGRALDSLGDFDKIAELTMRDEAQRQQLASLGGTLQRAMSGVSAPVAQPAAALQTASLAGISGGVEVSLSDQQSTGAQQQPQTEEARYALALARAAMTERNEAFSNAANIRIRDA